MALHVIGLRSWTSAPAPCFTPHPLSAWNPSPISSIDGNSKDQYLKWAIATKRWKKPVIYTEKGQIENPEVSLGA